LLHAELPGEIEAALAVHLGWTIPKSKTKRKKIRSIVQPTIDDAAGYSFSFGRDDSSEMVLLREIAS
jgi:hypothetical protein